MLKPNPQCDGNWKRDFWEVIKFLSVELSRMGLVPPESSLPTLPCEDITKIYLPMN